MESKTARRTVLIDLENKKAFELLRALRPPLTEGSLIHDNNLPLAGHTMNHRTPKQGGHFLKRIRREVAL